MAACAKCQRSLPAFQAEAGLTVCDACLIPLSWAWRHSLGMTEAAVAEAKPSVEA